VQADILDGGPDHRQATALCGEDIDLIGTLAHEAPQAFNGIRGLNVPVQTVRKGINEVGSQRFASPIDSQERFSKVVTL
jgi:hypothetical protein